MVTGESTKETVKTIARGMPGWIRWTCGDYARVLTSHFAREAAGALGARHSLRPLFCWANSSCKKLGPIAPRDREGLSWIRTRHIPSRHRPAWPGDPVFRGACDGIERPRPTGYPAGACHRARRGISPPSLLSELRGARHQKLKV